MQILNFIICLLIICCFIYKMCLYALRIETVRNQSEQFDEIV